MSVEKLEGYIIYGPLIYAKDFFEDDGIANYFWPGSPPVGYNNLGIPIDEEGMECLDLRCPLHPSWMPLKSEMEYNEYLGFSIPSYYPYIDWLKQNNLSCTPEQAKKLLFKWILNKSNNDRLRRKIKYSILQILRDELISLSELLKRVY
tara:strand:- start:593 stop:1039 length:447 start_codon:yes stop_codon:yes gene_type:complete